MGNGSVYSVVELCVVTWQWSLGATLLFTGEDEKVCRYELEEMVAVNMWRGLILFGGGWA